MSSKPTKKTQTEGTKTEMPPFPYQKVSAASGGVDFGKRKKDVSPDQKRRVRDALQNLITS